MTRLRALLRLVDIVASAMIHEPIAKIEAHLRRRRELLDMLFSLREAVTAAQDDVDGNPTPAQLEAVLEEAKCAVEAYAASPLAEIGECGGTDHCWECVYADDCVPHKKHDLARDAYYYGVAREDKLHDTQKRYDEMLTSALRAITGHTGQRR
jgi:hypothetical protein